MPITPQPTDYHTLMVAAPYVERNVSKRTPEESWIITVRVDSAVDLMRFPTLAEAIEFRELAADDIVAAFRIHRAEGRS